MIDCELYQGSWELDEDNVEPFGFDAATINYVLLTHAHLDRCGRLPLLAKRRGRGEIITTSASRELVRLVLLDAAHLLEEDVRHSAGRVGHSGANHETKVPLYSTLDALNCLDYYGRTAVYSQVLEVAAGVHTTCSRASRSAPKDFRRIGAAIARLGLPTAFVQEGGYLSEILGANLASALAGFEEAR